MTPKLKVGYVRISNDPQGLEAGVRRQEHDEREMASRRAIELASVYKDNDLSATSGGRRPQYAAMMGSVARGEVDTIIVWHLSRLWRNRRERAEGIELCKQHGVSVLCVKGPEIDCSTAYGRGVAGLLGELDTLEVEVKSERQRAANAQAAGEGRAPRAKRLFGYSHGHEQLIEGEAQAVRDAFARVLVGGSVRGVVTDLNSAGFTTPLPDLDVDGMVRGTGRPPRRGGRPWTTGKIHGLLRNPMYAGFRVYEGKEHPGRWPKIVEPEVWRSVQRVLDDPARFHGLPVARRWIGSNLFLCGVCVQSGTEHTVKSTYRSRPTGQVRVYRCGLAAHLSVRAEPVDTHVTDVICERLSRPDAAALLVDDDRPDFEALRQQAETVRVRIGELGDLFEEGDVSKAEYKVRKRRLAERLGGIESRMEHSSRAPLLADLITSADVRAAWAKSGLERQRQVIDLLCTVTLMGQGTGRRPFDRSKVVVMPKHE